MTKSFDDKEYRKQLKELSDKIDTRITSLTLGVYYNLLMMSMFNRGSELTDEEIFDLRKEQEVTSRRALRLSVWENIPIEKPSIWKKMLKIIRVLLPR